MNNQIVTEYTNQGLNRLAKEKLVTIISNLQNMPTQLAMKVSEHIPEYFLICGDTLKDFKSVYESAAEKADKDVQIVLDGLAAQRERWEKCFNEAKTVDEKERYSQKIDETNQKIDAMRTKLESERRERIKSYTKAAAVVLSLAGAAIGVTIKVGKRK